MNYTFIIQNTYWFINTYWIHFKQLNSLNFWRIRGMWSRLPRSWRFFVEVSHRGRFVTLLRSYNRKILSFDSIVRCVYWFLQPVSLQQIWRNDKRKKDFSWSQECAVKIYVQVDDSFCILKIGNVFEEYFNNENMMFLLKYII